MRNLILLSFLHLNFFTYSQLYEPTVSEGIDPIKVYLDSVGRHSILFNGVYNSQNSYRDTDHPFLGTHQWASAHITYKGIYYPSIKLRYNLNKEVIEVDDGRSIPLILDNTQIQKLVLLNRTFGPIGDSEETVLYEWLYKGNLAIAVKRRKTLRRVIEYPSVKIFYDPQDEYYLLKDGIKYKVSNRPSLLKLLSDKKKELKKFIRENRILYNENPERAMVLIVSYYDQLER